ncbi:MAG: hypothetical protein ACLS3M_04495 [Collinsella sp.]
MRFAKQEARIKELEGQVAEAAKSAEVADALRDELAGEGQAADDASLAADMATFATIEPDPPSTYARRWRWSRFGNLAGVKSCGSARFASSPADGLPEAYPSALTDLTYCFRCSSLVTIYADATWALPSSGVSDSQCFYNCYKLTGGNGTTYASSRTVYTHFRIDTTATPGYLTVSA